MRFSFCAICTQNNVTAPQIFWFRRLKLPSSFMLNNQNIKQKPIHFCIYLSYVLSQLTPVTTAIVAVAPSSSSSFCSLWDNTKSTQYTCFFFSFWVCQPTTLHFNLSPTTWNAPTPFLVFIFIFFSFQLSLFTFFFIYIYIFLIDKSNQYLNNILNFIYTTMLIRNIFVLYFIIIIIITINIIFNISYIKKG